jgi:phosphotransferase system enzyme I (PtsI)
MIGIVAVSHSARLGEAALELALQMVQGGGVQVRVAAGAGTDADGTPVLGTDAAAVATAIDDLADDCDGVLVLMDLGSAVMSAEMALEFRMSDVPVRLVPAPFVEGLLAAVVSAAAGGTLDSVAEEATAALAAKTGQLGQPEPASPARSSSEERSGTPTRSLSEERSGTPSRSLSEERSDETKRGDTTSNSSSPRFVSLRSLNDQGEGDDPGDRGDQGEGADRGGPERTFRTVTVRNPLGIHARPAALIAEASAGADVRLRKLPDGPEAPAASLSRLLVLGARQGDDIELSASGDAAEQALTRLAALFHDGFGEGTALVAPRRQAEPADEHVTVAAGAVLRGRGVSAGAAAASVVHLAPPLPEPRADVVVAPADRESEVSAIEWASVAVADELRSRTAEASGEARDILDASRLLASDPELVSDASALVRTKGRSAARAVWETAAVHEKRLAALGGRMAERVADIRDVRDRIIAEILEVEMPGVPVRDEPFVLVASDLAPADTAALEGGRCVALVTEQGGPTSHTAIIARSLGLPAVVGVIGATGIPVGATALVDGDRGTIEIDPSPSKIEAAKAAGVVVPFDGTGRLADGTELPLLANVGGAADAVAAADTGAEGVGLFRTEFCFLDRAEAPTVDEQVTAYRGVLAAFPGRRVVVRTLDAGSDKPLPFANSEHEENPALGVRGLRIARRSPALLDDQLRALALAVEHEAALVDVMAPMVATVDEARDFASRARAAGLPRVGIMIETPAAALLAAEILEIVDFASLGTNDLAQYTLAADRLLSDLADLNDPWQPAVLRLIGAVGEAGRQTGRSVGVCGEAGGDPALAPVLVGLGVTSLSMTSRALGRVATALSAISAEQCREAAEAVLSAATADEARAAASAVLHR